MSDDRSDDRVDRDDPMDDEYEAPAIEERSAIDLPLVATVSGGGSAAFHPADDEEPYDAPAIAERTQIDFPLIGGTSGPSAAFHPDDGEGYEPPAIAERTEIDHPLIGGDSTCAVFGE